MTATRPESYPSRMDLLEDERQDPSYVLKYFRKQNPDPLSGCDVWLIASSKYPSAMCKTPCVCRTVSASVQTRTRNRSHLAESPLNIGIYIMRVDGSLRMSEATYHDRRVHFHVCTRHYCHADERSHGLSHQKYARK